MSIRPQLKTVLAVLLVLIIAYLFYGLYQRSNAEQERLDQDTRRITTMLKDDTDKQP
jgi:hypothetical protein